MGQSWHLAWESSAVCVEYDPTGQALQKDNEVATSVLDHVPAGHAVQLLKLVAPTIDE